MSSHRVQTLSKNDWARGGLFQKPRLRINDKLDPNPGGLSSTEQFFNVCFCTAFGVAKVDKYLVVDQSLLDFSAYFFAWWYAWILGSEYASRYNNVDFTHNLFWMIYGGGVALMLEHTGGGVEGSNAPWFCYSCSFISCFVGLFTLRVGLYVPEAKISTIWHGSFMLLMSIFWATAGISSTYRLLFWFLALITEAISSSVFLLKFTDHIVPISKPYAINKFSIICVLALGAFVAAAVGNVNPEAWAEDSRLAVRGSSMLAFSIFINLKFVVVDVDPIALEFHALSRPIEYRVAWRLFQPVLILTIVAASAGMDSLLTESSPNGFDSMSRVLFGRKLAFFSTGAFFLALVFQREYLHLIPSHVAEDTQLQLDRRFTNLCQCAFALFLCVFPMVTPLSKWPLNLGDIIALAGTASTVVILHLVMKQRELEILDKYESSTKHDSQYELESLTAAATESMSWEASTNITQFPQEPGTSSAI